MEGRLVNSCSEWSAKPRKLLPVQSYIGALRSCVLLLSTPVIRARLARPLRPRRLAARRVARRPNQARVATASSLAGMTEPQGLRYEVAPVICSKVAELAEASD